MLFKASQDDAVKESIRILFHRMTAANSLDINIDDILSLIAPKKHLEILKQAVNIGLITRFGLNDLSINVDWPKTGSSLNITFMDYDNEAPLMPREPVIQYDNIELFNKVDAWGQRQLEISRNFGIVNWVFGHLSLRCTNMGQVRYLWPSIVPLCRMDERTHNLADKIADFRKPNVIPNLEFGARYLCRKAAGIVAGALLLPADLNTNGQKVYLGIKAPPFTTDHDMMVHPTN